MAKKDYYTSAQNYTDEDDMSRTFTNIDFSPKSKICISPTEEDISKAKEWLISYKAKLIEQITTLPASICPEPFQSFTLRGEQATSITWNTQMLSDEGVPTDKLMTLKSLLQNRYEQVTKTY